MGLFNRRDHGRSARPAVDDAYDRDYDPAEHQSMAIALADAFDAYDRTALAALAPAQRAEQMEARWALYQYIDAIWEDAKHRGLNPAEDPEWQVIAGLRDLTDALHGQAIQVQADAGDEG